MQNISYNYNLCLFIRKASNFLEKKIFFLFYVINTLFPIIICKFIPDSKKFKYRKCHRI
jgi:hypothetical protein